MPLACFSPRKTAIVLYQLTKSPGSQPLLQKLGKHTISGGCLHIKRLADVDQTVLQALVVNSVVAIRAQHPQLAY